MVQRSVAAPPYAEVEQDHCVLDLSWDDLLFHTRRLTGMAASARLNGCGQEVVTRLNSDQQTANLNQVLFEERRQPIKRDLVHLVIKINVVCIWHNHQFLGVGSHLVDIFRVIA